MKKRIMTLVAALALAATVVAPVNADNSPAVSTSSVKDVKTYATVKAAVDAGQKDADGTYIMEGTSKVYVADSNNKANSAFLKKQTDSNVTATESKPNSADLKPSGTADAKASVLSGTAKDNIHDNGITPCTKEFTKNSIELAVGGGDKAKATAEDLTGTVYTDLTSSQTGDVTFKLKDEQFPGSFSGDAYAIVLHYTGNAADEDGITAQYCKISAAGKVTAHFNSFSPVGIVATRVESAQKLVNTYSKSAGSDAGSATAVQTTPAGTAVTTPGTVATTEATAAPAADAAAAGAAAGKGAASPKTSDNAYALYLILAVAAVAGTTLVATKKTR